MSEKLQATFILPVWVNIISSTNPEVVLMDMNAELVEFFEAYGQKVQDNGDSIDIQWSANKHINLR